MGSPKEMILKIEKKHASFQRRRYNSTLIIPKNI